MCATILSHVLLMVFPYVKTFYVQPSFYSISNAVLPLTFFSFRDQSAFVMLHYARYFNGVQLEEPLNKVCFNPVDKTQAQVLFCINMVHFCITTTFLGLLFSPWLPCRKRFQVSGTLYYLTCLVWKAMLQPPRVSDALPG